MQTQRGVTLIELVMTIVIISAAIAGVVGGFSLIAGRSADTLWETRTAELAQLYLDEILTKRWSENVGNGGTPVDLACAVAGAEGGENRDNYDDVDDYDTAGAQVSAAFLFGSIGSLYSDYEVGIAVTCEGDELGSGFSSPDAKRIDVTIYPPSGTGQPITFTTYKANF